MTILIHCCQIKRVWLSLILLISSFCLSAQPETLSTGSFIVNMGATNPNTIANGLKPYGLVYDLIRNYNVPVKWVINQTKLKDGVDFTYNGVLYKGGTFIIPAEFRTAAVNTRIIFWTGQGVVGTTTSSAFAADVTLTITSFPKWTLDSKNGAIAEGFLINAGITNTVFPGAYNWKDPQLLDCCDDYFVMPHADPTWATHSRLWSWNKDCLGSIWAGCHAVSVLENMTNPGNPAQKTNFLSTTGLILFSSHSGGSIPYSHQLPNDPVAQYLGPTDLAQLNGSEQIYMPLAGGAWRPTTKIVALDPTQANIPANSPGPAALIVYGRGLGDPTRGYVMYEASHSINKGTANDVAAQRAFFNFSFFQITPKAPHLTVTGITSGQQVTNGTLLNLSVSATSPLTGISFTYLWTTTCGGTFSNATSANTTFNPPVAAGPCVVTCKVTDNCGRTSFQSFPVTILPPPAPPTVVNDVANISSSCAPGTSVSVDVMANDIPNASTISFTSLNLGTASPAGGGTWTTTATGFVTFTPNPNFNGAATITYTVTNTQGLSSNATITVNAGSPDANGCFPNSVYAPFEVDYISLANFVSQAGTGAALNGTALDVDENTYTTAATDYLNFGKTSTNNLIMSVGSTLPLRAKDTIDIYWSKGNNAVGTISIQIGTSGTGPWTNAQTFTLLGGSGAAAATISKYVIPTGVSGITYIRLSAGNVTTSANSAENVWLDAVDYQYLSCVSKAPQLSNDAPTVLEDAPAIINVLANDNDPQGLALTVKQITVPPTKGKVSINLDRTITYISNTDVNGADAFTYEACNNLGYCSIATVNVNIVADGCGAGQYKANPSSGAVTKIFQSGFAGTNAATANATATNFSDSWLNAGNTTQTNGGVAKLDIGKAIERRGIFSFNTSEIPAGAVVQSTLFTAKRVAGDAKSTITYTAHQITNSWIETGVSWNNRNITPTLWSTAGGDFNAAVLATTTVPSTNGFYNWNIGTGVVQNWVTTPANNFGILIRQNGTSLDKRHQFASREDGTAANRPMLTVTYVVPQPCAVIPNRAPLANPDITATVNGQAVTFNPLTNDADVDAGNTFIVTGVYGFTAGSATFTGSSITYTANINATVPRTEKFNYIITDNNGAKDTAVVYVSVSNAPPSVNSDNISTNSGTLVSIPVTTNDNDPEGGALTAPVITAIPKNGSASVVGNNIQYTPGPGFTGKDTLVYQLCEAAAGSCSASSFCDTALVVITINNQAPVATNFSKTGTPCTANIINVLGNVTDPEGNDLTVNVIAPLPANGTAVANPDGTITFTPNVGFVGSNVINYNITDNGIVPLTSNNAALTITIPNNANNAPLAVNDLADPTNMDAALYYNVKDNDSDPDGQNLSNPAISINPLHGISTILSNGLIQYLPNPGFFGADTLTYQICDQPTSALTCAPLPPLCSTAKMFINIIAPNTVVATDDDNNTWLNTPVNGGVMANDFDPEGDTKLFAGFVSAGVPVTSGSITVSGVDAAGSPVANAGTLTINTDGTYTYTPSNNFIGVVTVPYRITDNKDNPAADDALLRITVTPYITASNSIIANNDENKSYGAAVSSNVLVNDKDPQANTFSVTGFNYDSNGDGTADGTGILGTPVTIAGISTAGTPVSNAGSLQLASDGTYTYTPATDFHGSIDVPYAICDNGLPVACQTAILHIDVLPDINGPANDPPVAGDDFAVTAFNSPVNGNFTANDADPNNNTVSLNGVTITPGGAATPIGAAVSTVHGGTVQFYANGTYIYTPMPGFSGPDQVTYDICDQTAVSPQPLCTTAVIYFLVAPSTVFLPTRDIKLSAQPLQEQQVKLNWLVTGEIDVKDYLLERSDDGRNFVAITTVAARNNGQEKNSYATTDDVSLLPANLIYYRIRQNDINGHYAYSAVIAVQLIHREKIKLWPTIFYNHVVIRYFSLQKNTIHLQLTDNLGRIIRSENRVVEKGENQFQVSGLQKLAIGTYFLNITEPVLGQIGNWKLMRQ